MALLEVKNLNKIYEVGLFVRRQVHAVKNVNFSVERGEIISLVGESGSGKTTTAKMILRIEKPTSGDIIVEGINVWKDIKTVEDKKNYYRKVHAVFQDPFASYNQFYPIDRILHQALRLIDVDPQNPKSKELIEEALRHVGLEPKNILGKYPHQLSGGEKQRIMIARCWLLKPSLVIADEPVSMIDASTRGGIIKLFENLRDEAGTSVIFITHDMGLAYYISNRIFIMYKGEIVETGTPDEIISNPKHDYTKNLIGSIPTLYKKWEDIGELETRV
ncbi:ABC transporter ATP-binding protein [Dictyoglomus thermophilum]|uniref:Oligopeptide ABC transporter, ATP-binding protein n=1 Tax=Dictyoglomus thermophilum (strain ATCC 35947 / DSM 3960 / H-6-12) TaxID=309799 RepID=B5YC95_DICT6|nr:ATP-binding cassette domain-containing protein [Dictyoglomus thermophilum]ACI19587.1 oligopeptide ABC transporter, ATP-binding protein [Dictyoglomus thermophilum H-6-12]